MSAGGARILIVEDNAGKRYTLVRHLRSSGFEITEATTGAEGLEKVRAVPDLVILDVKLPDIDGMEVCRQIKADPLTSAVLVLELSAYHLSAADRARGLDLGADAYLVHPVDLGELVATVRSLLRLRQAERERSLLVAAVAAGEQRNSVVADTATVGLVQTDPEGRCTFMNRAAHDITGYELADLQGRTLHAVLHPAHADGTPYPSSTSAIHRVSSGGPAVREHRDPIRTKDGAWIPVRYSASPILSDGRCLGAVVEIKDDRDLVRAEQTRELFLAALGHDLRGPLQTIALGTMVLEGQQELPTRGREALRRINSASARMERLINQMLVFAQGLVEGVPLARVPVDLVEVAGVVVRDSAARAPDRAVELVGLPSLRGAVDPDRLTQVFENLISNAIRHGDGPVTVDVGLDGEVAIVKIHNCGTPITPAALPGLFDPFKRANGRRGGVGLGLYIVDQIVKAHAGTIEVTSTVEAGTTFALRLPLAAPAR
jgi:PAS domain S-box-containing protein